MPRYRYNCGDTADCGDFAITRDPLNTSLSGREDIIWYICKDCGTYDPRYLETGRSASYSWKGP